MADKDQPEGAKTSFAQAKVEADRYMDSQISNGRFSPDVRRAVNKLDRIKRIAGGLKDVLGDRETAWYQQLVDEIGQKPAENFDHEGFLRGQWLYFGGDTGENEKDRNAYRYFADFAGWIAREKKVPLDEVTLFMEERANAFERARFRR